MGQKVNPTGIRLGIVKDHTARWYAQGSAFADYLVNDLEIRKFIRKRLKNASVSRIEIERPSQSARVVIHTARPGIVIGKKGEDIDKLRNELVRIVGSPVNVNVEEVRKPELDATLVAESVAQQLERRIMFRRAMKPWLRSLMNSMNSSPKRAVGCTSRKTPANHPRWWRARIHDWRSGTVSAIRWTRGEYSRPTWEEGCRCDRCCW